MEMEKQRIQKILSSLGYCSRRKAEELVLQGRVKVNGEVVPTGFSCTPVDAIEVDGIPVHGKGDEHRYLLLNKPRGYVCTLNDPQGRKTVLDLIPKEYGRLFPVGRLDMDSSGLLLLTDDGAFSNLIMHPSTSPEKEYVVKVLGGLQGDEVAKVEAGLYIVREGYRAAPARMEVLQEEEDSVVFSVVLHEGKKREVRRMMQTLGHQVLTLNRVRIGNLVLGRVPLGGYRLLSAEEVDGLRRICQENRIHKKKPFEPSPKEDSSSL